MRKNALKLGLLFILGSFPQILMAATCPENHCSEVSEDLNVACKAAGYSNGAPFPVVMSDRSVCMCPCSCVVAGTKITMFDGSEEAVENLLLGAEVYAPYLNEGASTEWRLRSPVEDVGLYTLSFSNDSKITVSPNHTFITPSELVVDAQSISLGDEVLDENGGTVRVVNKVKKKFSGDLFNFAVNLKSSSAADHIIVNNGVQSGDWALQSANDQIESDIYLRMNPIRNWEGVQ